MQTTVVMVKILTLLVADDIVLVTLHKMMFDNITAKTGNRHKLGY